MICLVVVDMRSCNIFLLLVRKEEDGCGSRGDADIVKAVRSANHCYLLKSYCKLLSLLLG
jgi:hypothetical protein